MGDPWNYSDHDEWYKNYKCLENYCNTYFKYPETIEILGTGINAVSWLRFNRLLYRTGKLEENDVECLDKLLSDAWRDSKLSIKDINIHLLSGICIAERKGDLTVLQMLETNIINTDTCLKYVKNNCLYLSQVVKRYELNERDIYPCLRILYGLPEYRWYEFYDRVVGCAEDIDIRMSKCTIEGIRNCIENYRQVCRILPVKCREVLNLIYSKGYSYEETCSIMGLRDINSVRSLVGTAFRLLERERLFFTYEEIYGEIERSIDIGMCTNRVLNMPIDSVVKNYLTRSGLHTVEDIVEVVGNCKSARKAASRLVKSVGNVCFEFECARGILLILEIRGIMTFTY